MYYVVSSTLYPVYCELSVYVLCYLVPETGGNSAMSNPSLFEFLSEAELGHYYNALRDELRVTCVEHLKVGDRRVSLLVM